MSDLAQAALISGGIFLVMIISQYGRHHLSWHKVVLPLVSVGIFGYSYLKDVPTNSAGEWAVYGTAVALGLVFGAIATLTTTVERDATTGKIMTICGAGFLTTWGVAVVARLVFIWGVENVGTLHDHFGTFMMNNRIEEKAIAPFFVIWALTMVVSRIVAIQLRARNLRTPAAAAVEASAVSV